MRKDAIFLVKLESQLTKRIMNKETLMTNRCKNALVWWSKKSNIVRGVSLTSLTPSMSLITDASKKRLGRASDGHGDQGRLARPASPGSQQCQRNESSTVGAKSVPKHRQGRTVLLRSDNISVVTYLMKGGGTRSFQMNSLAVTILQWCDLNSVELQCLHLAGKRTQ